MFNGLLSPSVAACVTFYFVDTSFAYPAQYNPNLHTRASPNIVTGVTTRDSNANAFVRREVRDLRDNFPDQWNLYLLALDSLQTREQRDPVSYYGIASIHGKPFQPWGDAPGIPEKHGKAGYCPHNNQLFLGWHRPYIALFEQELQHYMRLIVQDTVNSSTADRFNTAVDSFRVPYWDWGLGPGGGPVPDFFLTEKIHVQTPDGRSMAMQNPLYSYQFLDHSQSGFDGQWSLYNSTMRWPTSAGNDAQSQPKEFSDNYQSMQRNLQNQLGVVYRSDDFASFAKGIEGLHGWIHGVVGGGFAGGAIAGHFWPLEYSAFDPMFMIHHCNVDRLFALYQNAHPTVRMGDSSVGTSSNVFLNDGETINGDTPLKPFRRLSNDFWTTNSAWDHRMFGYTYPELQPWLYPSDQEYRASVVKTITHLYGGSVRDQLEALQNTNTEVEALVQTDSGFTEWTIEVQASVDIIPAPFVVQFQLAGSISTESKNVGTWMILIPMNHEHDVSAVQQSPNSGTLSLTTHLIDEIEEGNLLGLGAADVVPYLKEKLTWIMYSGGGNILPDSSLSGLQVTVRSTRANVIGDHDTPVDYSGYSTTYPEVTAGKIGTVTK